MPLLIRKCCNSNFPTAQCAVIEAGLSSKRLFANSSSNEYQQNIYIYISSNVKFVLWKIIKFYTDFSPFLSPPPEDVYVG